MIARAGAKVTSSGLLASMLANVAAAVSRSRVGAAAISSTADCRQRADDARTTGDKTRRVLRPLYLDAQATTPMDPRVMDFMMPYMTTYYGNPHSRTHAYGWESEKAVEDARSKVADLIGADPKEIVFTSGATESNNIAVKGVARLLLKNV